MMVAPLILLLGTIGSVSNLIPICIHKLISVSATTMAYLALTTNFSGFIAASSHSLQITINLSNASLAFSIGTNAFATSLIGYRLWYGGALLVTSLSHLVALTSYLR